MEQPSLLKTVMELPGTLLRLPGSVVAALDAIPDVANRLDRLTTLVERMGAPMGRAGSGVDLAATGIASAVSGLEQMFGTLDTSLPFVSDSASVLRSIRERLGTIAGESDADIHEARTWPPDDVPERPTLVEWPEQPFMNLETVVGELAQFMETIVGGISGIRRGLDDADGPDGPDDMNGPDDMIGPDDMNGPSPA